MATIIPVGGHMAVYRWSLEGDPEEMVTTLGLSITFSGSEQERCDELYDQITASGSLTELAAMNQPWTFIGVTLYFMTLDGLSVTEHVEPITQTSGAENTPSVNVAVLVKKRTNFAGAGRRGRFYLPPFGVEETQITAQGMLSDTTYNAVATRVQGWYDNMISNDCEPVLHHADGAPSTPITSFLLDRRVATQRRRLR